MKIHSSITSSRVTDVVQENMFGLSTTGICIACGDEREGCEPDARKYECFSCGKHLVFGAEELLIAGAYHDVRLN